MANDLREHIYVPPHEGPYYSANTSPALQPSEPFGQPSGNNTTIPGPNLTDIESYLQESAHLIIDGKARKGKQGSNASKAAATDAIQLTPGGGASQSAEGTTRSATSTSILANTCQSKGINLVWDVKAHPQKVQGAEKFIGTLNVGTQTVSVTEPQSSKKDVRALLAERALPIAEEMERPAKKQKSESRESGEGEQVNWVGKLQEWSNSLPIASRLLDFTEYRGKGAVPDFATTVTVKIPLSPVPVTKTLGSPHEAYPNKKAAKTAASKAAVQHLISVGQLAPDGSVIKKPKGPNQQPGAPSPPAPAGSSSQGPSSTPSEESASFSNRVPTLALKLGFPMPAYSITPTDPSNPSSAFCDCTATFAPITGLPRPVATVRNIYGKKRAKEDCAREVCAVLEGIIERKQASFLSRTGGGARAHGEGNPNGGLVNGSRGILGMKIKEER